MFPHDWDGAVLRYRRVDASRFDAEVYRHCCSVALADLALGLGAAPAEDYLRTHLFSRETLALWALWLPGASSASGYGVVSLYTGEVQTAAYLFAGWQDAPVRACLGDMADLAFALEPARSLLWTHLPLPQPASAPALMVGMGYELAERRVGDDAAPCVTYALRRDIFDMYRDANAQGVGGLDDEDD